MLKVVWNKENAKNVCGVGFLRLSKDHIFTPACQLHDAYYELYSAWTKNPGTMVSCIHKGKTLKVIMVRRLVDRNFLVDMLKITAEKSRFDYLSTTIWNLCQAILFYALVRVFGGSVWRD